MAEKPKEQRGLKDRELQRQFESLQGMFASEGWKRYFVEFLDGLYAVANKLDGVDTQRELDYRKGQRDLINIIKAQPAVTDAAYESMLNDEEGGYGYGEAPDV